MNAVVNLDSQVDRLVGLVDTENPFDMPFSEVLPRQLEAINERFKDRVEKIKLLQNRAEIGGITEIRRMADVVPLLFAHTAYKSYPEGWLIEQKWDRLGRWLDTVSTNRVRPMDTRGIKGLDDWLQRLEDQDHYVSCSSGTTGKCAMMNATVADLRFRRPQPAAGDHLGGARAEPRPAHDQPRAGGRDSPQPCHRQTDEMRHSTRPASSPSPRRFRPSPSAESRRW